MQLFRRLLRVVIELAVATVCCGGFVAVTKLGLRPLLDRALVAHPTAASALGRTSILLAFLAGYWTFTHYFERRSATELAPRWRALLLGGVSGSLLIGVTVLTLFACGYNRVVAYRGFDHAWGVTGIIVIAATIEEITFRALLFRLLEKQLGTLWAVVASALVFGALHLANPGTGHLTGLSVSVLGIMWTGVFVLSRNLWATSLNHFAWNFTIFASGMPLSGQAEWQALAPLETATAGPVLLTGGAFGPEDSVLSIALTLLACVVLFVLAKRQGQIRENVREGLSTL